MGYLVRDGLPNHSFMEKRNAISKLRVENRSASGNKIVVVNEYIYEARLVELSVCYMGVNHNILVEIKKSLQERKSNYDAAVNLQESSFYV